MSNTSHDGALMATILRLKKVEQKQIVERTKEVNLALLQLDERAVSETELLHQLIGLALPLLGVDKHGRLCLVHTPPKPEKGEQMDLMHHQTQ